MEIINSNINDITPYHKNPRVNLDAIKYVADSIEQYGFNQPIVVDKDRVIIAGHTRYKAAQQLNLQEIPIYIADQLTEDQINAYRIADNKTSEYAKWDTNLLSQELKDLLTANNDDYNITSYMTAFSVTEIDRLLNGETYIKDQQSAFKDREDVIIHKRVGLLTLKKSYVNRGVGTYVNGWLEWGLRNNVQVDVISDSDNLYNDQFTRYEQVSKWLSTDVDYTDEQLDPTELEENADSNQFENYKDTHKLIVEKQDIADDNVAMRSPIIRMYDAVKLRNSIIKALSTHCYDALIVNTIDVMYAILSLGLDQYHDNIYYVTHAEQDVGRGPKTFLRELTRSILLNSNVKIITQSELTKQVFQEWAPTFDQQRVYPIAPFLGQPEFLEFNDDQPKDKILYIGPYEPRKNPEVFIEACKKSGKPALVIAPSTASAKKFKKRLLQEGITHEIHVALTGKNKVDVMKTAALAIIPSIDETYCYTAIECAHLCRTIIPENRLWTQAHKDWCIRIDEKDIADAVEEHYGKPQTEQVKQKLQENAKNADLSALNLLDFEEKTVETSNALTKYLDQHQTTTVKEFYQSRPTLVLDELFYAIQLQKDPNYTFTHTLETTVISKRGAIDG